MSFRPVSALIMESMVSDAAAENGILRNLKLEVLAHMVVPRVTETCIHTILFTPLPVVAVPLLHV